MEWRVVVQEQMMDVSRDADVRKSGVQTPEMADFSDSFISRLDLAEVSQ